MPSIDADPASAPLSNRGQPNSSADPFETRVPAPSPEVATSDPSLAGPTLSQPGLPIAFADPYATNDSPSPAAAPFSADLPDWPTIPGYQILDELGKGGMGVVYKARDVQLNRVVALKMILAVGQAGPQELARFRIEAEAVARLQHPHIVQIYEVGELKGLPYFSLEFVAGGSLAHQLQGNPQPAWAAARIVEQLADGVQAAHAAGIIHRDLKPLNVLMMPDGAPKLTDFGLAKKLDDDSGQTKSGAVMGTPSYMAPEQATGNTKEIGPAADVYALGVILYELLVGRPPFKGASVLDTLLQVRSQEPVPPSRVQPKVPHDLETICLKCLQKEPQRRYGTAQELSDDLHRFLNDEPILARPVAAWERALKWGKRNPTRATLAAVSMTAALSLVGGALLYQGQRAHVAEQDARLAHQEVDELRRQGEARDMVRQGQEAVAKQDWPAAQLHLTVALAKMGADDPSLEALRSQAQDLMKEVESGLRKQEMRQQTRSRYDQFAKGHDDTLFQATSPTSKGLTANLRATRDKARLTLALWDVSLDAGVPLALDAPFAGSEKDEVLAGCYELLLVLAEAEAQPLPGEQPETQRHRALHLLARASTLGWTGHPTQAYHLRRARYLEALGQGEAARQEKERAAARPPATALDYYLVGDERYKRGEVQQAIRDFERALGLQANSFWARYLQALGYLRTGHWTEAKIGLIACLAQKPDSFWARLSLATAHSQLGEFSAAEALFEQVVPQAPDPLAQAIVLTNRGSMWFRQQRWDRAVADLRQAIAVQPDLPEAYVNLAQVHRGRNDLHAAVATLDQAIDRHTRLGRLYRERALLQLVGGDQAAASRDFEQAIALEPAGSASEELADDHVQLGHLHQRARDYAAALASCDAALQVWPDYPPAHRQRAEALIALNEHAKAGEALDHYLHHRLLEPAAYVARGIIHQTLHQNAEAVEAYSLALRLKPDAKTLGYRGWAYLDLDASKPALADFEASLRLDKTNRDALLGRGHALVRLGKLADAVKDAKEALEHGPRDRRLLLTTARIYALAAGQAETQPESWASKRASPSYSERAVELLRAALDQVPEGQSKTFWRDNIQNEKSLNPIRRTLGFQELARKHGS